MKAVDIDNLLLAKAGSIEVKDCTCIRLVPRSSGARMFHPASSPILLTGRPLSENRSHETIAKVKNGIGVGELEI